MRVVAADCSVVLEDVDWVVVVPVEHAARDRARATPTRGARRRKSAIFIRSFVGMRGTLVVRADEPEIDGCCPLMMHFKRINRN